jgi:chitinase
MKKWILAALFVTTQAFAQNLVTNGDFENGTLDGWTKNDGVTLVSGQTALSGSFSALVNYDSNNDFGNLSQTIATTPGAFYVLKMNSNTSDNLWCDVLDSGSNNLAYLGQPGSQGFTATTNSTIISISGVGGVVDDVQVQPTSFSKPGKYVGTVTFTASYNGVAGVSSRRVSPITARIDSAGKLTGLTNQGTFITAIVIDGGVLACGKYSTILSSSVNSQTGAISFVAQSSGVDDLTGSTQVSTWTYKLKYSAK